MPGIFGGGDVITGAATVIEAVEAGGKRAAGYMAKYLQGETLPTEWIDEPEMGDHWTDVPEDIEEKTETRSADPGHGKNDAFRF